MHGLCEQHHASISVAGKILSVTPSRCFCVAAMLPALVIHQLVLSCDLASCGVWDLPMLP